MTGSTWHPAGATEVEVEAVEGTPFAAVRALLAGLVADGHDVFAVDGTTVADDAVLGEGALARGAVLSVVRGPAARTQPSTPALLELHVVGGPGAGRRIPLRRGRHVVGRSPLDGIRLADAGVSRAHSLVEVTDAGVVVRDLEPTNPSAIDGLAVPQAGARLEPGARLRLASTTLVLRRPSGRPAPWTVAGGVVNVHRQPRFVRPGPVPRVAFPEPPPIPEGMRLPLLTSMAPLVLSAVLSVVMHSPVMLLFALMSPVLLLGQWWSDRRHGRTSHRAELRTHRDLTARAEHDLAKAVAEQERWRREEHPDLGVVAAVVSRRDARLWERRPGDPDHLVVRVGSADQPARVEVSGPHAPSAPPARDVPVLVDLGGAGVTGLAGPRSRVRSTAAAVLAQLCTWHSPRSLRIVLLTTTTRPADDWGWAGFLPHLRHDLCPASVGALRDDDVLRVRVAELTALVQARADSRGGADPEPTAADVLVVLDGARRLREVPGVADLLKTGPSVGIAFLCLDETSVALPAETRAVVDLDDRPAPRALLTADRSVVTDVVPDLPDVAWVERLARAMAPLEDATPDDTTSTVPVDVGFVDLHRRAGLDPTAPEQLACAWAPGAASTSALVGVSAEGPARLDLRRDGPHVLVAGTTGAGKSELLQTLVAALAVANRPDELGFVLVDYKGGSAFKECSRLPHTLGLVTDLDEALTSRALTSLGAELKRRERLLAEAGAKDLDDYLRRRTDDPRLAALGRLVLVVDEFKMLADELPEFVSGLVRIAAVGRSLGIHLVLATQRPAGIVTADMRANMALRIALRVRDRTDSDDVIDSPVAAAISDRTPGRAVVRAGDQRLVELQTAHVGAVLRDATDPARGAGPANLGPPGPGPADRAEVGLRVLDWSALGRPRPTAAPDPRCDSGRTELAAVVDAAVTAAHTLGIAAAHSPWLPPLPTAVRLDDLIRGSMGECDDGDDSGIPIGLVDRPASQRQDVARWHLDDGHLGIVGGARTGRSSAARSVVAALADRSSPADLHVHVIEGRPGALGDLRAFPHVGTLTSTADPALARALVARLLDESRSGSSRTRTVLVVDGWETVEDAFEAYDHGAPTDDLLRLLRDGLASGVRVVVTGGRALLTGRLPGLLQRRLVLPMPDPVDLTLAGLDASLASSVSSGPVPGRAVDPATGETTQLAHVGAAPDLRSQQSAVEQAGRLAAERHGRLGVHDRPWRLRPLPEIVTASELATPGAGAVAVGVGGGEATTVAFEPARGERRVLVTGPPRSGRTSTLVGLAEQLARAGREVAAIACRRGTLDSLQDVPGVTVLSPDDDARFVELRRAHPSMAVVVDDAEELDGTPVARAVEEAVRLVEAADGVCVVAVESTRALSLFRGVVPEVARDGVGIVLCPSSAGDGDVLRVRVTPGRERRPGRGVLVRDGTTVPVQVARPAVGRREPEENLPPLAHTTTP